MELAEWQVRWITNATQAQNSSRSTLAFDRMYIGDNEIVTLINHYKYVEVALVNREFAELLITENMELLDPSDRLKVRREANDRYGKESKRVEEEDKSMWTRGFSDCWKT